MCVCVAGREAFNELLAENHWMDEETREVARDKANAMNERIGYPDYILNDTALTGTVSVRFYACDFLYPGCLYRLL